MKYQKLAKKHKPEIVSMIDKIKFYDVASQDCGTVFTVCMLFGENGSFLARGVSICSTLDGFNPVKGRNRALGRAIKAIYTASNSLPIKPDVRSDNEKVTRLVKTKDEQGKTIGKTPVVLVRYQPVFEAAKHFRFKSEYSPSPTKSEIEMFGQVDLTTN